MKISNGSVGARLSAWRAALSPTSDEARFQQRLGYFAGGAEEAMRRVEAGELFDDAAVPLDELQEALGRFESAPPNDGGGIPWGEVFRSFAQTADENLAARAGELFFTLSEEARAAAVEHLVRSLGELASPALLAQRPVNLLALPGLPPRREPYLAQVQALKAGRLRARLEELPVLARELARTMAQWRQMLDGLLRHLAADRTRLAELFPEIAEAGNIASLDLELGDTHRGGQRVIGVTFTSGAQLIYKPRDLRLDAAWRDLLAWLRKREPEFALRAPMVLEGGDHGWVEFVRPAPVTTREEAAGYYRRAGELLAVAWMCGASDFHEENLVATRNGPVPVDLETLFMPTPRPFGATEEELRLAADAPTFATSVLTTMLLPNWQVNEKGNARDLSGFGGRQREEEMWQEPAWLDIGTDRMREGYVRTPGKQPPNMPRDAAGKLVPPAEFVDEVVEGYERAMRVLHEQRTALLAVGGPLEGFRKTRIRFLLRDSRVYGVLRGRLRQPEALRSAADRSIEIEKLARPFLPPDLTMPCPTVWACYEAERRGMENGDIPKFEAEADGTTLLGDGDVEVPGYFWKSGWQVAEEKWRQLDDKVIREQAAVTRASLTFRRVTTDEPKGAAVAETPNWVAEAETIAEDLASRVIPLRTGGVSWLAPDFDPIRKVRSPALMGLDLYNGTLGVGIFLAALAATTGNARWRSLAEECTRPRIASMRSEQMSPFLVRMPPGLGTGIGSLIHGCLVLARLLEDERLLEDAEFFAGLLDPERDEPAEDILMGGAGALAALLNLHAVRGSDLKKARAFGTKLLRGRVTAKTGHRAWQPEFATAPLTGFGHGAAGFAWALQRLGEATGEKNFRDAADEAVAYERAVFDAGADNWPDFRRGNEEGRNFMHGWCAGPAGIGLARLGQHGTRDDETEREIGVAIRDATNGPTLMSSHLCCGQTARVEFLIEAARVRGDADLHAAATRGAREILVAQNRNGGCHPLAGADRGLLFAPSFFHGTAGIGYMLLRVADPTLPSIPAFAIR